jgi:GNAT superfamily N-acetyltransferase
MKITPLDSDRDGAVVRAWLADHIRHHLQTWTAALGAPWDDPTIDAHLAAHDLVGREWGDVLWAHEQGPRGFVRVARADDEPAGVLWAEERPERFLRRPVAALCWVFVAPAWRGTGVARALMAGYDAWAQTRPVVGREVYVTATNEAARRLYERHGLVVSDHRCLAPARGSALAPTTTTLAEARA